MKHCEKLAKRVGDGPLGPLLTRSPYAGEFGVRCGRYSFSFRGDLTPEDMPALEADILDLTARLKAYRKRWGTP